MASILEVDDCRNHNFIQVFLKLCPEIFSETSVKVKCKLTRSKFVKQFEPAPRRGEPDVTRRTPDYFL